MLGGEILWIIKLLFETLEKRVKSFSKCLSIPEAISGEQRMGRTWQACFCVSPWPPLPTPVLQKPPDIEPLRPRQSA